jgi:hypothetical protein
MQPKQHYNVAVKYSLLREEMKMSEENVEKRLELLEKNLKQ